MVAVIDQCIPTFELKEKIDEGERCTMVAERSSWHPSTSGVAASQEVSDQVSSPLVSTDLGGGR